MYQKKTETDIRCPLEYGLSILSGKWKTRIICMLNAPAPMRYRDIKEDLVNVTDGVLSTNLNELIAAGIIEKSNDSEGNLTEYSLTQKGKQLIPIIREICHWSEPYYTKQSELEMRHCINCVYYKAWKKNSLTTDPNS